MRNTYTVCVTRKNSTHNDNVVLREIISIIIDHKANLFDEIAAQHHGSPPRCFGLAAALVELDRQPRRN